MEVLMRLLSGGVAHVASVIEEDLRERNRSAKATH